MNTKNGYKIFSEAENKDLWAFAASARKKLTGDTYRSNVITFCKFFNTTPHKLISLDRLEKARKKADAEMTMEAEQEAEFVRMRIQRHVEKLAEQYIEHFKMKNGKYIEGKTRC